MRHKPVLPVVCLLSCMSVGALARQKVPPYDLWSDEVLARVRDHSALELKVDPNASPYFGTVSYDVFFTSNASADFFDAQPPYGIHVGEKIRIHAFLATPALGDPIRPLSSPTATAGTPTSNLRSR